MSDAAPPSTGASAAASESSAPVVVTTTAGDDAGAVAALEARDDDAGAVAALEAELAAEREVSMRLRADKLVLETNLRDAAKAHADELALVRARSAKSEEALQGALKMARAMSAAQRAKIDQSWQTQEALETEAGDLHAALEDAREILANETPIRFRAALHLGDVHYGNIGSRHRLDFTVIGPTV